MMEIADGFPCVFFIFFPVEIITIPITNTLLGQTVDSKKKWTNLKHDGEIKARITWNGQ